MEFLQPVVDVFNFISSILSDIIEGITIIVNFFKDLFDFILSLLFIFPSPFYEIIVSFFGVLSIVFIYKILRKG